MPFKSQYPDVELPNKSVSDFILNRIRDLGTKVAMEINLLSKNFHRIVMCCCLRILDPLPLETWDLLVVSENFPFTKFKVDNSMGGKCLTYEELYDQSRKVAGFLHKIGIRKGDVVGVCVPNCLEFPIVVIGILACGAVVAPCNPSYSEGEMLQQFRISRPKMVIIHQDCVNTMKKVDRQIDCLEEILVIGESNGFTTWKRIFQDANDKDFPIDININYKEDIAILPYSSGTTGLPKCVMLTHKNFASALTVLCEKSTFKTSDCLYMDRPVYHIGGYTTVLCALYCETKLIIEKEFVLENMLTAIDKYKVTHILTVPPILIRLINDDKVASYDVSTVKEIMCGGAALSPDVLRKIEEKFGATIRPGYGMTECGRIALHLEEGSLFKGVGKILPNMEIKIIDLHTREELLVNESGEILVRGPTVMKGYFKNSRATAQAITKDGWLHTGDIGHIDNNGIIHIIGRSKEVIKYKSVQVPPAELENVILKHPKVADVGVIGIPDTYAGELPKAFVVKKDDSLSKDEVDALVKEQLVDYKQLRGGIEFVDKIPKSATGKIQRIALKKMAGIKEI